VRYAMNGGVRIAYEVTGSGPPLVLVHANPFDRRMWLYQVAQYAPAFCTIAIDLRGYGESDKPNKTFTLRDMAEDVVAVCRHEHVARATFMGASVGAFIALLIALENVDIVNALVLVGGGARPAGVFPERVRGYLSDDIAAYRGEHIRQLVAPAFAESPLGRWLLKLFLDRSPTISGPCIAQIFRALDASDMSARLGEVRVPTLILNGELDSALPLSLELVQGISGAEHVVISGTGHACNLESPEAFDLATKAFLAAHGGA
jgi:3-oxoadipate enol-lactonase